MKTVEMMILEEDVLQIVPRIPAVRPDANVEKDLMEPNVKTNVKLVFILYFRISYNQNFRKMT